MVNEENGFFKNINKTNEVSKYDDEKCKCRIGLKPIESA